MEMKDQDGVASQSTSTVLLCVCVCVCVFLPSLRVGSHSTLTQTAIDTMPIGE